MPKYIYKPILEKVKESYLLNAKVEYDPGFDIESNVRIVIDAETPEAAEKARVGFIDTVMWQLDQTEG